LTAIEAVDGGQAVRDNTASDVYSALCTLSAIERQIHQLRDQLTALLASAHVPDTQQDASSHLSSFSTGVNAVGVAEKSASEALVEAAVAESTGIDLEQWLNDRGITIKQKRAEIAFDPTFDRLAKQLGDNYDRLCILYTAIKQSFGPLSPRGISLEGLAPQQIGPVVNFGNQLLRNGLLKEFRYDKKLKTVSFETQENGQVQFFFTGGWFERYVFLHAKKYLARSHSASEITALLNPKITLPDGQAFELDILIGTASVVLWLECKTGRNYQAYAARYQEIAAKHMRMSPIHSALVLLEPLTDEQKRNSSSAAGMSVLNLPDLGEFLDCAVRGQE
jgi:hypothetical protein